LLVNAFWIVRIFSIFCAIKKTHHLRTHIGLAVTINLEISEVVQEAWKRERVICHDKFVLASATKKDIVRVNIPDKMMTTAFIDFVGTLADQ
jgi:hypothetical protein